MEMSQARNGQSAQTVVMPSLLSFRHVDNVIPGFSSAGAMISGIILIIVGSASLIFTIVILGLVVDGKGVTNADNLKTLLAEYYLFPFMCIITGGFLVAAGRNKTKLMIAACLVLSIVTIYYVVKTITQSTVLASVMTSDVEEGRPAIRGMYAMAVMLAIAAFIAFFMLITSIVLTTVGIGCCAQVFVNQYGSGPTVPRQAPPYDQQPTQNPVQQYYGQY